MVNKIYYFSYIHCLKNWHYLFNLDFFIYIKFEKNKTKALLAVFIITLGVEFIQGFIPYRFCDIDDIILNTLVDI